MTNDAMFSFGGEFSFSGVQDKLSSSINTSTQKKEKGLESTMDQEMNNIGKQGVFNAADDWGRDSGGFGSLYSSDYGILYGNDDAVYSSDRIQYFPKYLQQQPLISSECGLFGDVMHFDALSASPPFQLQECLEEISKLRDMPTVLQLPNLEVEVMRKEKRETRPFSSLLAGLDLLNNYGSRGFKRFNGGRIFDESTAAEGSNHTTTTIIDHHYQDQDHPVAAAGKLKTLSTEEIVRVAGARFIRTSSSSSFTGQVSDATSSSSISMLSHPFEMSFSGLSEEETRDVELVEFLLASAEKVGYQQYERATKLLDRCDSLCSSTGRPVERLIFYFAEALRDKIDRETGIRRALVLTSLSSSFDIDKEMMRPNEATLACQTKIPFGQVVQFAGTQAIVEHVAEANKVHIIDLQIRNGVQWTGLMQALASRRDSEISSDHNCNRPVVQLELLKISAVGTTCNEDVIADTGRRLESFARSINLPFSFKTVTVPDMLDLKEDMFEIDPEETVAVYAAYALRSMIPQPDRLESVMRVIKNIRPCVTVVSEVEANHNSPVFVTRFIEALFFFGAYFDCVETCIEQNDPSRRILESQYFGNGIRSIVATEGEERKIRHVKIDVWRAFFARYGMEEIELSSSSLYQADLVIRNFSCGNSCTLNMDGKCLLVGWKGTPLNSLSLWKFL